MPADSSDAGDADAVVADLLATFRNALGRPDFDRNESFMDAGGDSLTVIETILRIEESYGVALSAAEFMALATAERLGERIASGLGDPAHAHGVPTRSTLSVVQVGGARPPLICVYGVHGEAAYAVTLAGRLPPDQPVAMLNVRADVALGEGVRSLPEFAVGDAERILDHYGPGPFVVAGFSMGAHVALAVGHELIRRGVPPPLIAVLDDDAELIRRNFVAPDDERPARALESLHIQAKKRSPAEPIPAHIAYFRAAEDEAYFRSDPTSGWGEIATGGVTLIDVESAHRGFVLEPALRQIAPRLSEAMAAPRPMPPSPDALRMLRYEARRAARAGDVAAELRCLDAAIAADREQPSWVYANLAEAQFQNGDTEAALAALKEARKRDRWPLTLDIRFIGALKERGLRRELEEIASRLAALQPDHPSVHHQMRVAYDRLGLHEDADRHLRAGLAMQPLHARLSFSQMAKLKRLQSWPELRELGERMIEAFPRELDLRATLIDAYTNTGAPMLALRFRQDIQRSSPPDVEGLLALTRALLRCRRDTDALETAELAVRHAPWNVLAQKQKGDCLATLGRRAEALSAYEAAGFGSSGSGVFRT